MGLINVCRLKSQFLVTTNLGAIMNGVKLINRRTNVRNLKIIISIQYYAKYSLKFSIRNTESTIDESKPMNFFPRRLRRPVEKFRNFQFKVKQNTNSIFSTTTKKHFNLCDCNEKLFLTPYQTWGQRTLEINEIMAPGERGEPFKWIQKNKRIRKKNIEGNYSEENCRRTRHQRQGQKTNIGYLFVSTTDPLKWILIFN